MDAAPTLDLLILPFRQFFCQFRGGIGDILGLAHQQFGHEGDLDEARQHFRLLVAMRHQPDAMERRLAHAARTAGVDRRLDLAFAQRGWEVYGVDASPEMLERARAKAAALGLRQARGTGFCGK